VADSGWQQRVFAEYAGERRDRPVEGFKLEPLDYASRYLPLLPAADGFLNFTDLPPGEELRSIRDQMKFFQQLGTPFEWKVYDFDRPSNLRQLLETEGFVAENPEAFMVFSLDQGARSLPADPDEIVIRQATCTDSTIEHAVKIQETVWQRSFPWLDKHLRDTLRSRPDELSIYCAYSGGRPVGSGWIRFAPDSRFADIHGGAVLEELRGRGIYGALFRRRLEEARRRQYEYLAVDAAPMSRPILEKRGFRFVCNTYPMKLAI
jgi:GNAT superfamily N-acetyltransferase